MADVSILSRLVNGVMRNVDMSANTLVTTSIKVGGGSPTELTKTILDRLISLQNGSDVDATYHTHDGRYFTETELGSTADGSSGASLIGVDQTPAFTNISGANLQAIVESIDTALGTAGGTVFDDATFRIEDAGGDSLGAIFDVSAVTTADKTITMPDANVNLGDIATNNAKVSADGSVTSHSDVTDAGSGAIITTAERSKLSGIEALADVTDATNVAAAGAVMESDTSTALMSFVIDEDNMVSDSATKVPTQQSVKAYVDAEVASAVSSEVSFKGDYNAATNTPDLDTSPIATALGDMYVVTAAGNFFTIAVEVGDIVIAKQATATLEAHWTVVQANLTAASIKTQYESNADTNAFTDAEKTNLGNQSGTNTGDEAAASDTVSGIVELATIAETDTGTDATRAVTPAGLAGSALQTKVNGIEALADVTDATNVAAAGAVMESDTTTALMSFVLDEDNMVSDSATKLATQQSIKAYADTKQPASANLDEADTFFGSTDLSASEAETLSDGSNADALHSHSVLKKTFTAGESFAANTSFAVRIALTGETAGRVYKADFDASASDKFYAYGMVEGSGAAAKVAGDPIVVVMMGSISLGSSDTNFDAGEVGQAVHLKAAGAFDAVSTITYNVNEASYRVGVVQEVGTILVGNMQLLGIN